MDYKGQALAENIFRIIMWLFGVIGLIVGHIVGSFYVTFYVAVAGMLVAMAAVVPDWPYLNRNPILFTLDSPDDKDD